MTHIITCLYRLSSDTVSTTTRCKWWSHPLKPWQGQVRPEHTHLWPFKQSQNNSGACVMPSRVRSDQQAWASVRRIQRQWVHVSDSSTISSDSSARFSSSGWSNTMLGVPRGDFPSGLSPSFAPGFSNTSFTRKILLFLLFFLVHLNNKQVVVWALILQKKVLFNYLHISSAGSHFRHVFC